VKKYLPAAKTGSRMNEMNDNTDQGPSNESLKALFGMLPSFIKGVKEGKVGGKGRPAMPPARPTKVCRICLIQFDLKSLRGDIVLEPGFCKECTNKIDQGMTALTHGNKIIWTIIRTEHPITGKDGEVCHKIELSGPSFDKVLKEMERQEGEISKPE
jgi:hypothetical protein